METRQKMSPAPSLSCRPTAAPTSGDQDWKYGPTRPAEDILQSMHDMGTAALVCGITNVLGVAFGTGHSHNFFPRFYRLASLVPKQYWDGSNYVAGAHHENGPQLHQMNVLHNFNAGLIARTLDVLSTIKEGDGTAADNTVCIYLSENGDAHHAERKRCNVVVVGNAGGKLRADGRFISYPAKPTKGYRSLADLYCTIATAMGVPTDSFGKGGLETVQGPMAELLV